MTINTSDSFAVQPLVDSEIDLASLDLLDHRDIEWQRVRRTAFLIHQHIGYAYEEPIEDLRHRLIVVPPERHLDQRRVVFRVDFSAAGADVKNRLDEFGNTVFDVFVPRVQERIDFEIWVVVERGLVEDVPRFAGRAEIYRLPSRCTEPDGMLSAAATEIRAHGDRGQALARRIGDWVHSNMRFTQDVTSVRTTAAEALALGQGVCQDYAHVMIALCRLCRLPARYVSGHLLGEGGTHAWVEVLIANELGELTVYPFDPTHGGEPAMRHVTVAVGRDYIDVAPTSGTFQAQRPGRLSAHQRVGLTAVDYR